MLELKEHQFEILPSVDAAEGVPFGIGTDVSLDEEGFKPGGSDWMTQDSENASRGTTSFGRDVLLGPTWAWELFVNREDVPGALESLGKIATAWRAQKIRETPGAVLPIRYRVGDRVRRIYGRPRRFDAPPSNRILSGFVPVTCDFKAVDAYTYEDAESSVTLGLANTSEGGFVFPVTFPVVTLPVGDQRDYAAVAGDADTYPVIRFDGPISNPTLETDDWKLSLDITLGATDYVVIDTRPWVLTAMLNGTASVAGSLGRRQPLSSVKLEPGNHELRFGGASSTGGATCTVSWRGAFNSI